MTPNQFVPFWDALTAEDQQLIQENLQIADHPGSGFFSSKRFMTGGLIFLLQGHIRLFLASSSGREITLVTMDPFDNYLVHPGEGTSKYRGQLRFETSEDCRYAFLPKNTMTTVMRHSQEALEFVLRTEELLIRSLTENVSCTAFLSIQENLARTLLEKSTFTGTVRLTHEELGHELGTTRVVISRELKKMEDYGLIKLGRGEIEILYRDGLIELTK